MNSITGGETAREYQFAQQHGIRLYAGRSDFRNRFIAKLNDDASDSVRADGTATYRYWQLDYYARKTGEVMLSRAIAELPAGTHTEPAYWFRQTQQPIEVHRGVGELIMAAPQDTDLQVLALESATPRNRHARLVPNNFYAIRATATTPEPLVVSSLYAAPINWEEYEIGLEPGAGSLIVPAGSPSNVQHSRHVVAPEVFLEQLISN